MGVPDPVRDPQFYDGVIVRRLVAFLIDAMITLALVFVVIFFGFLFTVVTAGFGGPLSFLATVATGFTYRWLMLSQRSATLGMVLTGIEVRDAEGSRLNSAMAFLHTAAYHVTVMFPPLAIVGWILMVMSPYGRALHDLPLGTVVINRPE